MYCNSFVPSPVQACSKYRSSFEIVFQMGLHGNEADTATTQQQNRKQTNVKCLVTAVACIVKTCVNHRVITPVAWLIWVG